MEYLQSVQAFFIVLLVFSLSLALGEWKARREKEARARAEAKLQAVKRRGEAPFFAPVQKPLAGVYELEEGNLIYYSVAGGNVLSVEQEEVAEDSHAGSIVVFPIENCGKMARSLQMEMDGYDVTLYREPNIPGARELCYLRYAYDPGQRGKVQRLTVRFETGSGVRDTHVYETEHGRRVLRRIDPA